jgi:hypothetical protein
MHNASDNKNLLRRQLVHNMLEAVGIASGTLPQEGSKLSLLK